MKKILIYKNNINWHFNLHKLNKCTFVFVLLNQHITQYTYVLHKNIFFSQKKNHLNKNRNNRVPTLITISNPTSKRCMETWTYVYIRLLQINRHPEINIPYSLKMPPASLSEPP